MASTPSPQQTTPFWRSPILLILTVVIGLFFARSPITMTTTAPTADTPWADQPLKLITTPQYETKKTDLFTAGATHMALLHNSIFRGYNSIYLQAPYVAEADKGDFMGYCLTWHKFVKSHAEDEEENLFTKVEELLDDKTVFAESQKEHESLATALEEFSSYLTSIKHPAAFSGIELRRIMDGLRESFESHFRNEIATIAALASHPKTPKPGSPEEAAASTTFKTWGKTTVTKAGMSDVVPFFLLNLDGTYEDGMWANWPPIPPPIKWGLINIGGMWHSGWWKFTSCSGGRPKALYAQPTDTKAT